MRINEICLSVCLSVCLNIMAVINSGISTDMVEHHLEPVATRYLKRWCHLSHCAATSLLYLQSNHIGRDMPAVSTSFKSFQVGQFCHLLLSRDDRVRNLANAKANREADDNHHKFWACSKAMSFLRSPDTRGPNLKRLAKTDIKNKDESQRVDNKSLCDTRLGISS